MLTPRRRSAGPSAETRRRPALPEAATRRRPVLPEAATRRRTVLPHAATRRQPALPDAATRRQPARLGATSRRRPALLDAAVRRQPARLGAATRRRPLPLGAVVAGQRPLRLGVRIAVVAAGALLALPLATGPAGAAPGTPTGPSVIGDGNLVGNGPYVDSANPDPEVDATAGATVDNGCVRLAGTASPADVAAYQRVYGGEQPQGEGNWRYQVCARSDADARRLAAAHPDASDAKAFCGQAVNQCAVVVVWEPKEQPPQRQERLPQRKLGAFNHWLDFTPELATSPTDQNGLIARLPTWVWDRNTADVRGICLPIYGGVCGFAVRLGTSWKTEGRTFCRTPGREYRPGVDDPRSASSCGWTYRRQGTYGLTGCKNWLVVVWRLPWYIPIVFPLELCSTHQVGVRESQVLAKGREHSVRVG